MITTSDQTVADDMQHRLEMLLWQARIHEENGKKQEASKIRQWVARFLSSQPKIGLAPVAQTKPSHARRDPLERRSSQRSVLRNGHFLREMETQTRVGGAEFIEKRM